jgi:hypothetical protein
MVRTLIISTYIFFLFFNALMVQAAPKTNGCCAMDPALSSCSFVNIYTNITADTTAPLPPAVKKGILKKIGDFFKFRSNADAKWVARVKRIIDTLGLVASIAAEKDSILRIHKLTRSLTDSERIYYDTLLSILNRIEDSVKVSSKKIRRGGRDSVPGSPDDTAGLSAFSPVMDNNMQELVNKILDHLPKTGGADKEASSKAAYLAVLGHIESSRVLSDTIGDTVKHFRVILKKKRQIYGFHNATLNAKYAGYRFDHISALVYNALIIQGDGTIKQNGWDTAKVIGDAEAARVGLIANFLMQDIGKMRAFLGKAVARAAFIRSALGHLKLHHTTGVNIVFNGLPPESAEDFAGFIAELKHNKEFRDSAYKLFVTLPIVDKPHSFKLSALDTLADNFIVNFVADPQHPPIGNGPIFPLSGSQDNSMQTCISGLTSAGLKRGKLIMGIPYFGVKWKISKATGSGSFVEYLAYEDVRARSGWTHFQDPVTGGVYLESPPIGGKSGDSIYRIWTDDEEALGKKYDYIDSSQLNGIAISTLGYDARFGELWDELAYKLLAPDSVALAYEFLPPRTKPGFFGKLMDRLYLYGYIVEHPCERCFDNIQDSLTSVRIYRYLDELGVDSLIGVQQKVNDFHIQSRFEFINEEMRDLTIIITLGLILIALLTGIIYFYQFKTVGDQWKWRKKAGTFLSVLILLVVLFAFTWSFCDKRVSVFGPVGNNLEKNRYQGIIVRIDRTKTIESNHQNPFQTNADYCNDALIMGKCINIPLSTFLFILAAGMAVGYGVNWLYHTVVHNEDNP